MYFRFVVTERHEQSGRERGVFSALYALQEAGELSKPGYVIYEDAYQVVTMPFERESFK